MVALAKTKGGALVTQLFMFCPAELFLKQTRKKLYYDVSFEVYYICMYLVMWGGRGGGFSYPQSRRAPEFFCARFVYMFATRRA